MTQSGHRVGTRQAVYQTCVRSRCAPGASTAGRRAHAMQRVARHSAWRDPHWQPHAWRPRAL